MIAYAGFTRPEALTMDDVAAALYAKLLPKPDDCICGAQGFLVCRSMTSILDGSIVDLYSVECQKGCNKLATANFLEQADAIKSWNALVKNNHP